MAHPGGRPTLYTDELADKICLAVATQDKGLDQICEENNDFPNPKTIYAWRLKSVEFSKKYLEAKSNQAHIYAESTLKIAQEKHFYSDDKGIEKIDPGYVAWQKLNVNTRQWHASKLAPKVYGDQRQIEELKGESEKIKAELAELQARLAKEHEKEY